MNFYLLIGFVILSLSIYFGISYAFKDLRDTPPKKIPSDSILNNFDYLIRSIQTKEDILRVIDFKSEYITDSFINGLDDDQTVNMYRLDNILKNRIDFIKGFD